jgi:hypothetical protein
MGEFRTAVAWLKSAQVNAATRGRLSLRNRGAPYENRAKSRKRAEKCESEILVNGFIVARVDHKTKPQVVRRALATASQSPVIAEFTQENQQDRAA